MHIEKGKKDATEMRIALLDRALDDMAKKCGEIQDALTHGYIEARRSGADYDIQEHHEAVMRKIQEVDQKTQKEMQRIRSMNNEEITMLYCKRFPE